MLIEANASFTGLDNGDVLLCGPIPNTTMIGVYRIKPSGAYVLVGLMDDPIVTAAGEQARKN